MAFSIVITGCSSAICEVLSINSQVQVQIRSRADEERTPTSFIGMDSQFSPLDAVMVVATCIFLLSLNLLSFNFFHCCFHLKFYITFLYCVRVTTLPLVRRRILFQRPLSVPLVRYSSCSIAHFLH